MHPILFKLGPITIRSYGVMVALGILAGLIWLRREFNRKKLPEDLLYDLMVASIALGVVGARILYVALNWHTYKTNLLTILMIWADGGLSFHGAVGGGILAGLWLTRRYKVSFWKVADAVAPALAIGHFFGRIGCFLNGCCYGVPTNMPWGFKFFNPALGVDTLPSHPTQLYEAFGLLVLFFLLAKLSKQPPYEGAVFIWWVIFYSVLRFVVEYWRAGVTADVVNGLTEAQWLSLFLFSIAFAYHRWRKFGK
ncbi:MAG: prolipoprotein diacylglyceryl transferase [Armatimonadetes bacterium]|nr:prolipoprotein diacylglyceryl transferase [Armatimonadota bacterium]MDW8028127.1 prolipoprotein diacylglyceryl transferase [Armatimonadota bacterium]